MASSSRALTRFGAAATRLSVAEAVRPFSNFATTTSFASRPLLTSPPPALSTSAHLAARQFARTYAAAAAPAPKKKPGKIRTTFKWLWRATYLSLFFGIGAAIYDGYQDRHPGDQLTPDPQKKTLVILGELQSICLPDLVTANRGRRIS